jgi:uncharacterized phage protein gp47/JayE
VAIEVTSLDQLDPTLVANLQAEFVQLVNERHPEVDLSLGVFHDLIAHFSGGISGAINQYKINEYLKARSLKDLNDNPEGADNDLVDLVLSNYLITRRTGAPATGEITIVVAADVPIVLSNQAIFESSGATYFLPAPYVALPSTSTALLELNERRLVPIGDGSFVFSVPAVATRNGAVSNIQRGTTMTPQAPPDQFIKAYAATDFVGGSDTETNTDLLTRLQNGVAAKCMQGRTNIIALLQEQPTFAGILHYQIIGYGNAEMQRNQHTILPIGLPGYIDIYPRTTAIPQRTVLTKTATYVGLSGANTVWQFSLDRDDAPGFYEVDQVINKGADPAADSGYEIQSVLRGINLAAEAGQIVPDIINAVEGAFTRFQTAVVRFINTDIPAAGLTVNSSKRDFDIYVTAVPLIRDVQAFCSSRDVRNLTGDVLVRAPIPCFLTVSCEIQQSSESLELDLNAIRNAIATRINALVFPTQLNASTVAAVIHSFLTTQQAIGPIELFGRILLPDGTETFARSTGVLELPDRYDVMATGNTIAFYLDPQDIVITVVNKGFELVS